jgi:hypothetical protein
MLANYPYAGLAREDMSMMDGANNMNGMVGYRENTCRTFIIPTVDT